MFIRIRAQNLTSRKMFVSMEVNLPVRKQSFKKLSARRSALWCCHLSFTYRSGTLFLMVHICWFHLLISEAFISVRGCGTASEIHRYKWHVHAGNVSFFRQSLRGIGLLTDWTPLWVLDLYIKVAGLSNKLTRFSPLPIHQVILCLFTRQAVTRWVIMEPPPAL